MASDLAPDAIAEIARVTDAATPGPWQVDGPWWWNDDSTSAVITTANEARTSIVIEFMHTDDHSDMDFIAIARTAIPDLLAALTAKDEEIARARGAYDFVKALAEERGAERDSARQEVAELTVGLHSIVDRHPEAEEGEHPAVDIARALLARIETP